MADSLDTGDVLAHMEIGVARYSTVRGLQLELDEVGVRLVPGVVVDILSNRGNAWPLALGGRVYRKPRLSQIAALEKRVEKGLPGRERALLRIAKKAIHSELNKLYDAQPRQCIFPQ